MTNSNGQIATSFFIRAFQFGFWGAAGTYLPFINAYFRGIGLSGTQIGLIGMASALMAALGAFVWGLAHDRLGKSRLVFSFLCWGALSFTLLLSIQHDFALILPLAALLSFFSGPMVSQVDSMTLKLLGPHTERYGSFRAWGTVGFVLTSAVTGFFLQSTGIHFVFYLYAAGFLAFWLITQRLPDRTIHQGPNLLAGLSQMARNPRWLLLMGSVLVLWISVMGAHNFLSVLMKDMGSSESTIGLVSTIAAAAEIPLLVGGPVILRRFGANRLILFAMAAYVLRMVCYSLAASPEVVLALSLAQSITYCPLLVGIIYLANDLAPDALKSTSQGLLGMVMSLSNVVGGLAGGRMYDTVGQHGLYLACAATALAALALFGSGLLRQGKKPGDLIDARQRA